MAALVLSIFFIDELLYDVEIYDKVEYCYDHNKDAKAHNFILRQI